MLLRQERDIPRGGLRDGNRGHLGLRHQARKLLGYDIAPEDDNETNYLWDAQKYATIPACTADLVQW